MHISADMIHTDAIINAARAGVRVFKYSTAFVMLQYLSNDIKHRFIIDAVHNRTSMALCTSHHLQVNYEYGYLLCVVDSDNNISIYVSFDIIRYLMRTKE